MNPPIIRSHPIRTGRPRTRGPDGAIVHSMTEYVTGKYAPDFLQSIRLGVHAMITPDGEILDCIPTSDRCSHAGVSEFKGRPYLNGTFLGAEFLIRWASDWAGFKRAITQLSPYTEQQYEAGGYLYAKWMKEFSIPRSAIVGHSAVSGDDVRGKGKGKIDPGPAFDWNRFFFWVDKWSKDEGDSTSLVERIADRTSQALMVA